MDINTAATAFAALSQPLRLDVFRRLVQAGEAGMAAGDIADACNTKQNTMSANLSALRQAGLIHSTREGRSIRYHADHDGIRRLLGFLLEDCCGGNPELCQPLISELTCCQPGATMTDRPRNVLFLCTGNSARSILAEAIMNATGSGRFRGYSAGSHPSGGPHPRALALLEKIGHPTDTLHSKSWDVFAESDAPKMDFIITVCDNAAGEICPVWPGKPATAHWGLPDPAAVTGSDVDQALAFADTYRMLVRRIEAFAALPLDTLDGMSLQSRLDAIGATDTSPETA